MVYRHVYTDAALHTSPARFAAALIELASTSDRCRRNMGVNFVRLPRHVKSVHYAWVMLGIAIAMRLVSSVERTASLLHFPWFLSPVLLPEIVID